MEIGYITFIRPILEYADVIYYASSMDNATKLERVQLEVPRIVTSTKCRTYISNELYLELGWLTLKNRQQFNKLSKLFTITTNQYPPYLKTKLDTITNYHSYATREHITCQLPIPKCKTEFCKKSFFPFTIKLWNELHGTIRDSVNKSSFKKAVCSSKFNTTRIFPSNIACSIQVTFTQLWVGFSNLNHDLYCKGCTDTESCDCGHIIEDSKQFFSNLPSI